MQSAILNNIAKHIRLTPKEEQFFLSLLREAEFVKGDSLLKIGDVCRNQSFVVKGCLKIFYLEENGEEHIAKFAVEDWWAFDIASFFQYTPSFYGITCIEDAEVLQLSKDAYETLTDTVPAFEKFYRIMMQNSFIALQHRITQSQSLPALDRYLAFQKKYPGLESRISQKQIASYLGITPVFLSMLRKQILINH